MNAGQAAGAGRGRYAHRPQRAAAQRSALHGSAADAGARRRHGRGRGGGERAAATAGTAADPNAVVKPVGPTNTVLPAAEKPAEAPLQVNDIKPGQKPAAARHCRQRQAKKPKVDLSEESSSKKKKKKGLGKLNPF